MERIRVYLMSLKFSKCEMLEMEKMLSSFLEREKIQLSIPVDIFELASSLGFDIRGAELKGSLEGLLLVNEHIEKIEPFESNKLIAYNCQKEIFSKKFIVAHELMHYVIEKSNSQYKKVVVAARDHEQSYSDDVGEQKMDYLAASLFIPRDDLKKRYENLKKDEISCEEVATVYNVDFELAKRRIEEVFGE